MRNTPEALQRFLQLSVVEKFSVPLCRRIQVQGLEILTELHGEGPPTSSLEGL